MIIIAAFLKKALAPVEDTLSCYGTFLSSSSAENPKWISFNFR